MLKKKMVEHWISFGICCLFLQTSWAQLISCGNRPLDVVFVLDSSTSLGADNFQIERDFVAAFVNQSDLGPNQVRVGLVTFNSTAKSVFYLNTYASHTDNTAILTAIAGLHFQSGTSATDKAIKTARYFQLAPYNGARQNADKIVIVLTDGRANEMDETLNEAYLLKKSTHALVVAIGVGTSLDWYELESIASGRNYTFNLTSPDLIPAVLEKVKAVACNGARQVLGQLPACTHKMVDVVFVLDSSASEGLDNFQRQVDFIRDLASKMTIGPQNVQMSVVVFSRQVHEAFTLGKHGNQASLLSALGRVTYTPGNTQTGDALSYVRTNSFNPSIGGRGSAARMVVVLTDGRSSDPRQTATEASLLKQVADVIAIGIGVGVDLTELDTIASDENHALAIANFDALKAIQSQLIRLAC